MSIALAYGADWTTMMKEGISDLYDLDKSGKLIQDSFDMLKKSGKFIYQTYGRDLPYVVYKEIGWIIKDRVNKIIDKDYDNSIEKFICDTKENTKNKVVILLPGALSTTASLDEIKKDIRKQEISYYALNYRLTYFNHLEQRKKIIKETLKLISKFKKEKKEVILFGYSYGGSIARTIGNSKNIHTITLSSGDDFRNTPFTVYGKLIIYFKNLITNFQFKDLFDLNYNKFLERYNKEALGIPKVNNIVSNKVYEIGEDFSFSLKINPTRNRDINRIKGQYSHFLVNNKEVKQKIIDRVVKI